MAPRPARGKKKASASIGWPAGGPASPAGRGPVATLSQGRQGPAAGVGEHSPVVRDRVLAGLDVFGIAVDAGRNAAGDGPRIVSPAGARVAVCVVPTDEEHAIAHETAEVLAR